MYDQKILLDSSQMHSQQRRQTDSITNIPTENGYLKVVEYLEISCFREQPVEFQG